MYVVLRKVAIRELLNVCCSRCSVVDVEKKVSTSIVLQSCDSVSLSETRRPFLQFWPRFRRPITNPRHVIIPTCSFQEGINEGAYFISRSDNKSTRYSRAKQRGRVEMLQVLVNKIILLYWLSAAIKITPSLLQSHTSMNHQARSFVKSLSIHFSLCPSCFWSPLC